MSFRPLGCDQEQRPPALLIIGHGTRNRDGRNQFAVVVQQVATGLPQTSVVGCFLELAEPTIQQAWSELVALGYRRVVALPLLLFSAGHAKRDIPQQLASLASENPQTSAVMARPLSRHPSLLRRTYRCIEETLLADNPTTATAATTLVMVGRGSFDPCATTDMRLLSELIFREFQQRDKKVFASVETCFYAMAEPRLPAVLQQVCQRGGVGRVVVHPHLLFSGELLNAIHRQVDEASRQFPGVKFLVGKPLGPDTEVADSVLGRYRQACGQWGPRHAAHPNLSVPGRGIKGTVIPRGLGENANRR